MFANHGFAGTVDSTVTISLGTPQRSPLTVARRVHGVSRSTEADYRAVVSGAMTTHVRGNPAPPFCGPLAACGVTGTITLSTAAHTTATFEVDTAVNRPPLDALTALGLRRGGNRRGLHVSGEMAWHSGAPLRASLGAGAQTCRDTTTFAGGGIQFTESPTGFVAVYSPGGAAALQPPLRTRCPGPDGPQGTYASAAIRRAAFARRTITISLSRGARFSEDGYSGATVPRLTLTLTRTRIRTRTFTATEFTGP